MKFDENIKREIILDHYQHPTHHGLCNREDYLRIHMASESCIDDIHVELKIENDVIVDGKFDGVACAISTSSTSIMLDLVIGKTCQQALEIINAYTLMVNGKEYDDELLEEANAFDTLHKQANRIKCGLIGIQGIQGLIKESESADE
ncbi:MAG: SUF system NifU family Fe-S cluster assembly protein [Erysipelotrichaceae bacterium]